jgi:hypothetical protein
LTANPTPEVRDALDTIASEHVLIHGVIARLEPRWSRIADAPNTLREHARALVDDAEALRALWEKHLALEERVVFPAIDRLEPEVQRAVLDEMRGRRSFPLSAS